jgi:hypothetical protein
MFTKRYITNKRLTSFRGPGMGEIEKVGNLKSLYQKSFEKFRYQKFFIQDEKVLN